MPTLISATLRWKASQIYYNTSQISSTHPRFPRTHLRCLALCSRFPTTHQISATCPSILHTSQISDNTSQISHNAFQICCTHPRFPAHIPDFLHISQISCTYPRFPAHIPDFLHISQISCTYSKQC